MSTLGALAYNKGAGVITPPAIGDFVYGGYYAGLVSSTNYSLTLLIVGDATAAGGTGNYSTANSFASSLNLNTYTDWILPLRTDTALMYSARLVFAGLGQGYNTSLSSFANYWTSETKSGSTFKWCRWFYNGTLNDIPPTDTSISFRCVRYQTVTYLPS